MKSSQCGRYDYIDPNTTKCFTDVVVVYLFVGKAQCSKFWIRRKNSRMLMNNAWTSLHDRGNSNKKFTFFIANCIDLWSHINQISNLIRLVICRHWLLWPLPASLRLFSFYRIIQFNARPRRRSFPLTSKLFECVLRPRMKFSFNGFDPQSKHNK